MRYLTKTAGLAALAILLLAGCGGGGDTAATEPPPNWETTDTRWWKADVDTAQVFHNLESLEGMGVAGDAAYAQSAATLTDEQLARTAKNNVIELYRHNPQVIDSLFAAYVAPELEGMASEANAREEVNQFKDQSYTILRRHFREPRSRLSLGEDVPVAYPDSLKQKGVEGRVRMQVRLNEAGEPLAVEMLEGVHPLLDDIAMRAATQMRWEPAMINQDGEWQPIPSWVRFNVNYRRPPSS